jgi:hypothetical protein
VGDSDTAVMWLGLLAMTMIEIATTTMTSAENRMVATRMLDRMP